MATKKEKMLLLKIAIAVGLFFAGIALALKAPLLLSVIIFIITSVIAFLLMLGLLATGEPYKETLLNTQNEA